MEMNVMYVISRIIRVVFITLITLVKISKAISQPDWHQIRSHATFHVADTATYFYPEILSIHVDGWEDGLYVTRDGKHLFSTYIPIDIISWLSDWYPCIDFKPYYRGLLLDIDTITNIFGCPNYIHSDIVKTERMNVNNPFNSWHSSKLRKSMTFEGGACGVQKNTDTFDVFVFTLDEGVNGMEIMLMRNVSTNPDYSSAVPILSSPEHEDNPHIERLSDSILLIFFDRARYIYYSLSYDNGSTWSEPSLVTSVLNDHAPYDTQPHLWFDGNFWWVYFCADNPAGYRSIYRSRQLQSGDWNNWSPKELVIAPLGIGNGYGDMMAIGEPSLTSWGDIYFVVCYGNSMQSDTTNVYDCDPWLMRRKQLLHIDHYQYLNIQVYPNPTQGCISIKNIPPGSDMFINDMQGREICRLGQIWLHEVQVDLSFLKDGIYILTCQSSQVKQYSFFLIHRNF
ncbi:MAG: hypothetical protein N2Z72_00900 [Bacteroidales bacterium]|nr:hypothetical protein [Bacteroidales bacterium]